MNKVGIIGFGRFGNLLYEILKKGFEVEVFDINPDNQTESVDFLSLEDVFKNDTIFLAVPIRDFEKLITAKDFGTEQIKAKSIQGGNNVKSS